MQIHQTERLYLREAVLTDAPFFVELMNSAGWLAFIGDRNIKTNADAEKYISNSLIESYQKNGFGLYLMSIKNTHEPIGICGLVKRPTLEMPDLGFGILPKFEGKGYVFEAGKAVLELTKSTFEFQQILAITVPQNGRSKKLLERLGFSLVQDITYKSGEEKLLTYSIDMRAV